MTRWQDISDEDKRDFAWVEVTDRGDVWPTYVKGMPRQPGKPARRWEYRQETFATDGIDETKLPPWENRLLPAAPREFLAEQDWLNALGAEGWELVVVEEAQLHGRVPVTYYPSGADHESVQAFGSIPAKRWTFKREVSA